jgi:hypothetical protein
METKLTFNNIENLEPLVIDFEESIKSDSAILSNELKTIISNQTVDFIYKMHDCILEQSEPDLTKLKFAIKNYCEILLNEYFIPDDILFTVLKYAVFKYFCHCKKNYKYTWRAIWDYKNRNMTFETCFKQPSLSVSVNI